MSAAVFGGRRQGHFSRRGFCRAVCIVLLASSCAVSASPSDYSAFIKELREFTGEAGAETPIADRIVTGFEQYPPRQLTLDDGVTIYWGWQHGQAFVRSIAIRGTGGQLKLAGAMDHIPLLYSRRSNRAIADEQSYQSLLSRRAEVGDIPEVRLFAGDTEVLAAYYPLVRRWLQAAMLGFNANCSDARQAPVCGFVEQVDLPVTAFVLHCDAADTVNDCALPIPEVPAADIALELFRQ